MKNRDEEMTERLIWKLQTVLRLLNWLLYGLDVGNYSKINESNFIGDIDELWMVIMQDGIRSLNSEVMRLFGTAKYIYSRLHLKVIHGYHYSMCI